jgi:CBS domain-containing protein
MAQRPISELMTEDVVVMPSRANLQQAGKEMRARDIGDVIVIEEDTIVGILTDRDIVVRAVADDRLPSETTVGEVASRELQLLDPDDSAENAMQVMREKAVRRLPVVQDGRPVGIVSIGDLALDRDTGSALTDISAADPND